MASRVNAHGIRCKIGADDRRFKAFRDISYISMTCMGNQGRFPSAAWAAARRAIGTRYGEQDT